MTVSAPRWPRVRSHPVVSAILAVVLLAGGVTGGVWAYGRLFPPALSCGKGMTAMGSPLTCVGVDLAGGGLRADEEPRMRQLEGMVKQADDEVTGDYAGVVLLLDLTPQAGVDTVDYTALDPNVEGAITALWRANHTAAFGSQPPVKLFLANMGSKNQYEQQAVQQIIGNRAKYHLDAVIGLGQSTTPTRQAAATLTRQGIPVIGATVTGDSMNLDPATNRPMNGFTRVSPSNSDTVMAASAFIKSLSPHVTSIAIVQDTVGGDDYVKSLREAADTDLRTLGARVTQLPYTSPTTDLPHVKRASALIQQFHLMHANLCQAQPDLVYFAGRGEDLGAFVDSLVEDSSCGFHGLKIITGDDGAASITEPAVTQAIRAHQVSVYFTLLASPDEWRSIGCQYGVKANYTQFWSAFTGRSDPCGNRPVAETGTPVPRLDLDPADLNSGQAMLTHDAARSAFQAARDGTVPGSPAGTPPNVRAALQSYHCASMLGGASGWLGFATDGNPIDKAVPVVEVDAQGGVTTKELEWLPKGGELLALPKKGQVSGPGC